MSSTMSLIYKRNRRVSFDIPLFGNTLQWKTCQHNFNFFTSHFEILQMFSSCSKDVHLVLLLLVLFDYLFSQFQLCALSIAIILMGKRELVAFLNLSS